MRQKSNQNNKEEEFIELFLQLNFKEQQRVLTYLRSLGFIQSIMPGNEHYALTLDKNDCVARM